MMANQQEPTAQSWGTLEELLLACAVNRHGTKRWECVAMEIQNRRSAALAWLTPQLCEDKFNDLTRRFMSENDADFSALDLVPMVDQLRRVRVEELRREVRQRDDSIVSLELKLKRLEEERGMRSKEEADLGREANLSPVFIAGKPAGEEDSGERDDRSFNESNSTSQKSEPATEIVKNWRNDVVEANAGEETRERKAQVKTEPNRNEPEPVQLDDEPTVDRVDDDDDNKKQSSDVQSSASLSKKKRPPKKGAAVGGTSSGDEPEREEVSPAKKRTSAVKREPLIRLLEMIRAHRLGSAFERRQRSQESAERYKALIKQHIDLQTIQSRLDKGLYSNYNQKFFRDLLLLFNNVMIFHHKKKSQEHTAAKELLALVRKEMATMPITRPAVEPSTVKSEPEKLRTLMSKPTKTSTVVACNKRGSVKALTEIVGGKGDSKKEKEVEEKVVISEKKVDGSLVGSEEKGIKKKRSKEIAVAGQRSSKTGNKSGEVKHEFGGNEISSHDATEVKTEKKENVVKKKQGAASFLKRIKQNSPSEVTTTKNDENEGDDSDDESKDEKEEDEKGGKGRKKEVVAKNVKVTRGGRGAREENGRGKRGGGRGRPPKRGAAVSESPVKRGRENGENESGSRARKRSRR